MVKNRYPTDRELCCLKFQYVRVMPVSYVIAARYVFYLLEDTFAVLDWQMCWNSAPYSVDAFLPGASVYVCFTKKELTTFDRLLNRWHLMQLMPLRHFKHYQRWKDSISWLNAFAAAAAYTLFLRIIILILFLVSRANIQLPKITNLCALFLNQHFTVDAVCLKGTC